MIKKGLFLMILFSLISGCGNEHRPRSAKVDEISINKSGHKKARTSKPRTPNTYRVTKGDTLYSIGFRYQIDYRLLAKINNIKSPYRIYPGQNLTLKNNNKKSSFVVTKPVKSKPKIQAKTIDEKKPVNTQQTSKHKPIVTQTTPKKTDNQINKKPDQVVENKTNQPAPKVTPKGNVQWIWPTKGNIRTTFLGSNPARKGISISGMEGQPVNAAAEGVVVYSGSGLLGYGELIIIKHNEEYLSAYGHNKRLLVNEGETVKRGQQIAELGSSGTNVNNLHFEIRKNGKPVNPLNYVKP